MNHKPRVLFFSVGDSTRSQIAEGFLRTFAGHEFIAVSTATQSVEIDPVAREVMREVGIDISGQRGKELRESLKEHFSYVVTICDVSREKSPVWPFARNILHWSLFDPERVQGTTDERRQVFREARDEIGRRVREFLDEVHHRRHWSISTATGRLGFSA
jgi:arsenate reductase